MKRLFGYLLFLSVLSVSSCLLALDKKSIAIGETFKSPDARFTATFLGGGIRVKNNCDNTLYPPIGISPPLRRLQWTGDSTTIVTRERVSRAVFGALIHFDGRTWHRFEAFPTGGPYLQTMLVEQKVGKHRVEFVYLMAKRSKNIVFFYRSSFIVNPDTNDYSNVRNGSLGKERYQTLVNRERER